MSMSMRMARLVCVAALVAVSTGPALAGSTFKTSLNAPSGGAWGFVTTEPDWGGPTKTALNDPASQTFPASTDGEDHHSAMFGPGHHAISQWDISTPTTHAWTLVKFDLGNLYNSNNHATGDGTVSFNVWWNQLNTGFANTRITDPNAPIAPNGPAWGHGTSDNNWVPGSLALYEIPAGKLPGSNSTSVAAEQNAFQNASYNSLTNSGSDPWLPIRGSMTALTMWDGVTNLTFTIPQATINRWIADPASYNGLVLGNVTPDERFRNGGILFRASDGTNVNTLTFSYAPAPEPATLVLLAAGAAAALRRRR